MVPVEQPISSAMAGMEPPALGRPGVHALAQAASTSWSQRGIRMPHQLAPFCSPRNVMSEVSTPPPTSMLDAMANGIPSARNPRQHPLRPELARLRRHVAHGISATETTQHPGRQGLRRSRGTVPFPLRLAATRRTGGIHRDDPVPARISTGRRVGRTHRAPHRIMSLTPSSNPARSR